ncbi:MAG: hypothetical protein ACJ76I_00135 [Gaiellaceae bacterium]
MNRTGAAMIRQMIPVTTFVAVELGAGAALALWTVARFPRLGPRSLRSAILFVGVALLILQLAPYEAALMGHLPHGAYVALFACILPSFFAAFLAVGWLMRLVVGQLGGSGGDSGHLAPASSR